MTPSAQYLLLTAQSHFTLCWCANNLNSGYICNETETKQFQWNKTLLCVRFVSVITTALENMSVWRSAIFHVVLFLPEVKPAVVATCCYVFHSNWLRHELNCREFRALHGFLYRFYCPEGEYSPTCQLIRWAACGSYDESNLMWTDGRTDGRTDRRTDGPLIVITWSSSLNQITTIHSRRPVPRRYPLGSSNLFAQSPTCQLTAVSKFRQQRPRDMLAFASNLLPLSVRPSPGRSV